MAGPTGIEPSYRGTKTPCSAVELRPSKMVHQRGLEPRTQGVEVPCSIQLSYWHKIWSEREDLNLRHPAPKAGALPGCATLRKKSQHTRVYGSDDFPPPNCFSQWTLTPRRLFTSICRARRTVCWKHGGGERI